MVSFLERSTQCSSHSDLPMKSSDERASES